MKRKTLLAILIVFCAAALGAGYYFLLLPQLAPNNPEATVPDKLFGWKFPAIKLTSPYVDTLGIISSSPNLFDVEIGIGGNFAYSTIRDPGGIPRGLPVRLKIPVIGVDSAIEDALITSDGRMDVPAGTKNVAWFALGPHPGAVGSAVIGGHYGINNGVKFVFYDLDKLKVGDKVYIVDDKGDTLAFVVRSVKLFDRTADATTVFTSSDGLAHLNLITCEGVWNKVNGNYPQRRVVFTDAIPSEGAAPTSIITAAPSVAYGVAFTFSRSLGIGSSGADVVALQTALEQRGLLELPPGVTNGYFGPLTRAAVAKYQTSVGLPSVGAFGPLTRAKLIAELGNTLNLPTAGASSASPLVSTETTVTSNGIQPSALPQIFFESVKSLFATPLDGFITSLLLIAIVFITLKIIKRERAS